MTKKQIFSIRKYKIGVCSALIGATLLSFVGSTAGATDTMKSVSATVTATNHDVKELSASQVAQIMKGIPELNKLNCGDTVHFAFEKDGKVVVTNEVPKKGDGITTTIQEPTKEIEESSKKLLPNTGAGESSFNQAVLVGFITVGATIFVIYKRKQSAKALVLLLAIGGIGYATNVNATGSMFNTSYSIEKSSMITPSVEGYKYVGYWIEPGNCDIPNNYPTVELPSVEFKVPNDYPKVELFDGQVPEPNTGNVVVRYVADDTGEEIKELLKLKENEKDKTPYKTERIPIIDSGDYVYKLIEEKLPSNEDGAVAEGKTIEVVYRYVKEQKRGNVVVKYVADDTGEEIKELLKLKENEPVNSDYSAERIATIDVGDYVYKLVEDKLPTNETGTVIANETIEVEYRYVKEVKRGSVVIEFLNAITKEKITYDYDLLKNAPAGDKYSSIGRVKNINGYLLLESEDDLPKNERGVVKADETIKITYLYMKEPEKPQVAPPQPPVVTPPQPAPQQIFNVIVNYVSNKTGEVISTDRITKSVENPEARPDEYIYPTYDLTSLRNESTFTDPKTSKVYNIVNIDGELSGTLNKDVYITVELEDETLYGWGNTVFKDINTEEILLETQFSKSELKPVGTHYDLTEEYEYFKTLKLPFNGVSYVIKDYEGELVGELKEGENRITYLMSRELEFTPLPEAEN